MGDPKIKSVAISGAGGFVGSHLAAHFRSAGIVVHSLSRLHFTDGASQELERIVGNSDIVINLAGAPINHRWTEKYRKELFDSRINTTRMIVGAIGSAKNKPRAFFSASAVGYYSEKGCNTESKFEKGTGLLSQLCEAWENEARLAESYTRTVIMRFGMVLSPDGGVMKQLELPTRFKTAAILGNGRQYFSWIDINDLIGAVIFISEDENMSGTFNFVAPQMVSNEEFTRLLAQQRHSWVTVKVPRFFFNTLYGEASSFILSGQCVIPERLLHSGYVLRSPDIEAFFRNLED